MRSLAPDGLKHTFGGNDGNSTQGSTRFSRYRLEIDGLRAIAVLAVMTYHAGFTVRGLPVLPGGLLGVDIFFVISGYLIGFQVISQSAIGRFSLWRFYERRARRILPALFVVLAVSLLTGGLLLLPASMTELAESAFATVTFWSNAYFLAKGGYGVTTSELRPLLHTWSLSVEEQFYVVVPLAVMLFGIRWCRFGLPIVATGALLSLAMAEILSRMYPEWSFYMLHTRAWELLAGVALADLELRRGQRGTGALPVVAGLIAIAASLVLLESSLPHPGLLTVPTVMGTAAVIWFGGSADVGSRLLSSRPFVAIGLISYSVYLWQQPVFAFARLATVNAFSNWTLLGLAGSSFLLGWASWWFIERPFRNHEWVSTRKIWLLAVSGTLAIGGTAGAIALNPGFHNRVPAILNAAQPEAEWWRLTNDGRPCHDNTSLSSCHFDLGGDGRPWVLIGDSHAGAIAPSLLRRLTDSEASSMDLLSWGGCPVIFDVDYTTMPSGGIACRARNDFVRDHLRQTMPSIVVYLARMPLWLDGTRFDNGEGGIELGDVDELTPLNFMGDRKAALAAAITKTLNDILDMGHKIILIYPVPEVGWDVPRALHTMMPTDAAQAREWLKEPHLTTSLARYVERSATTRAAYDAVANRPSLVRVYPADVFCASGRCRTYDADAFFYSDDDHLSAAGAAMLVQNIFSTAGRLVR